MSKKLIYFIGFILLLSCSRKNKVYLIKQWHPSPGESTLDTKSSQSNPKFQNQLYIYKKSIKLIDKGSDVIIAEGCEDEAEYREQNFNGWDLESLKTKKALGELENILAPVPLKLKAEKGNKIKLVCGDNKKLLNDNSMAFSDLRGFTGFFLKLLESDGKDIKSFKKYQKALGNIVDLKASDDSIAIAKEKALYSLKKFKELITLRNYHFVKSIALNIESNPILIVGGLHIKGIAKELSQQGIDYEIITPDGYPDKEDLIIENIKGLLNQYKQRSLVLYQVPSGFDLKKFPLKNLLKNNQIAKTNYFKGLQSLALKEKIPAEVLLSDFDGDGIRDFSLSASSGVVVLSAEDNDWDNDGVLNLLDETIGKIKFFTIKKNDLNIRNSYSLKKTSASVEIGKLNERGIDLIQQKGISHDLLILRVLNEVLKKAKYPKDNLKTLVATHPSFSYGRQTFFSYNKQSKSLEIYAALLLKYLSEKKKKEYADVKIEAYVNGVVIPILIHSLAHEIGHMQNVDTETLASQHGWKWKEKKIDSAYLTRNRAPEKAITKTVYDVTFKGKSYAAYLKEHKKYLHEINTLLKKLKSDSSFKEKIKESKWYVQNTLMSKQLQTSFLLTVGAPSLYGLSSLSEWYAETFAACLFNHFYPAVKQKSESIRFEVLIGFNPYIMSDICQ